jgi:hypothetical protein
MPQLAQLVKDAHSADPPEYESPAGSRARERIGPVCKCGTLAHASGSVSCFLVFRHAYGISGVQSIASLNLLVKLAMQMTRVNSTI